MTSANTQEEANNVIPAGSLIMGQLQRGAITHQYMGTLADADAKSLVTRTYNTTKEEAAAVDRIVGSPLTLYSSNSDFVRHAIYELIMAYEEAGFPDQFVSDITAHLKSMRESAQRLRLRQSFQDVLIVYENALSEGMETGDFDLVVATLTTLEGYLDRTPEKHWRVYLQHTILKSSMVKTAIDNLYEHGRIETRYMGPARKWLTWLDGLGE